MNIKQRRLLVVGLLIVVVVGFFIVPRHRSSPKKTTKTFVEPTSNLPSADPPQEVIAVVSKYIQARENGVGADQTSPTAWLAIVQPITTAAWFAKLQPPQDSASGSASGEYNIAHNNSYVIKANLTKCIWNFKLVVPTSDNGAVTCDVSDVVVDKNTGQPIPNDSLPFGWSRIGQQNPITLKLVKQSGIWLVDEDAGSEPD